MQTNKSTPAKSDQIDQLNSFLRGELSAVETYEMALDKIDKASKARAQLERAKASHQERIDVLTSAIRTQGGEPAAGSGPWGVFAKAVEGAAGIFGEKAAIAALEEGEDHGLKDYRADVAKLGPAARKLVESEILPKQEQSHRTLSDLKKQLAS
ncbi:MAG: PA2169 family four-helix-bundle protein [Deltaproteobacteria bacterium]|nr:PA2169 family four-helix-bundle protein [Deltaproteobacteria bacterium]